jgi:hypothetical protein
LKRLWVISIVIALASACTVTDLNRPCTLVRGNPDGGLAIALLKSDPVIKNSANKDFISFGTTECEDRVCVRDALYVDTDDGGTIAQGYCSKPCSETSTGTCASELDNKAETKLSCRPLILDEATLAAIKAKDPDGYFRIFGMTESPFFCARGAVILDGGK